MIPFTQFPVALFLFLYDSALTPAHTLQLGSQTLLPTFNPPTPPLPQENKSHFLLFFSQEAFWGEQISLLNHYHVMRSKNIYIFFSFIILSLYVASIWVVFQVFKTCWPYYLYHTFQRQAVLCFLNCVSCIEFCKVQYVQYSLQ